MKDNEKVPKKIDSIDELLAYLSELEFYTDHFFEGVRLAKENDLFEAEMMFRKSLEGHQSAGAWFNLGESLRLQSKEAFAKAVEFHKKYLDEIKEQYDDEVIPPEYFTKWNPEDMEVLHDIAIAQYRQQKVEDAQETVLYILSLKPDELEAWELLMRCLLVTGRFKESERIRQLIEALKKEPVKKPSRRSVLHMSRLYGDLGPLSQYGPLLVMQSFNLMVRWAGNAMEFLLDIMKTLERVLQGPLKQKQPIEQAIRQGMPQKLAENTMKQLLNEGLAFTPKRGYIRTTAT